MKMLIISLLSLAILGAGAWFAYDVQFKKKKLAAEREAAAAAAAAATPVPAPVDPSVAEFEKVREVVASGSAHEAREALRTFIQSHPQSTVMAEAVDALGRVNVDILFSGESGADKSEYVVAKGDTLVAIASKAGTTAELVMRMNNLESTMLRIGDRLLLPQNQFSLRIHPASKVVDLYDRGQFFKRYKAVAVNLPASDASTTVKEKIAWREGKRVAFGSKEFVGSARWIVLGLPGAALYAAPAEGGAAAGVAPPGRGIELPPDAIDELHAMLPAKTEVTIFSN